MSIAYQGVSRTFAVPSRHALLYVAARGEFPFCTEVRAVELRSIERSVWLIDEKCKERTERVDAFASRDDKRVAYRI